MIQQVGCAHVTGSWPSASCCRHLGWQVQSAARAGKRVAEWVESKYLGGAPSPEALNPPLPPLPQNEPWVRCAVTPRTSAPSSLRAFTTGGIVGITNDANVVHSAILEHVAKLLAVHSECSNLHDHSYIRALTLVSHHSPGSRRVLLGVRLAARAAAGGGRHAHVRWRRRAVARLRDRPCDGRCPCDPSCI